MQARDEKAMRDHVLTAERLIMLETGFRLPAYHLHGDVAAMCAALEWDEPRTQCAWNITNDRCSTWCVRTGKCNVDHMLMSPLPCRVLCH
jgi:hypothetical protein